MGACKSTPVNATEVYPAADPNYLCALKVFVGSTCVASILGALLIIAVYIIFRDLRTPVRYILVCISVADILVAWAHLWGVSSDLERFLDAYTPANFSVIHADFKCVAQATIAVYATLASFLWTIALAWYVFFTVCCRYPCCLPENVLCTLSAHLFCWGAPLIVVTVLGGTSSLGFTNGISVAWCYNHIHQSERAQEIAVTLFSYSLWSYATFAFLFIFAVGTCCIRMRDMTADHDGLEVADVKLIIAAVILIFLRFPSLILDITVLATPPQNLNDYFHSSAIAAGVFFAGIGNSAQGLANAILFMLCTEDVRRRCCRAFDAVRETFQV